MTNIIVVLGRGLAHVVERGEKDGRPFVRFQDHGPCGGLGMWTWADKTRELTEDEARAALQQERKEAGARKHDCNSPGCWCIPWLSR